MAIRAPQKLLGVRREILLPIILLACTVGTFGMNQPQAFRTLLAANSLMTYAEFSTLVDLPHFQQLDHQLE